MDPGLVSRTSQAVALTRAEMSRPHTEQGDPGAQRRLCEGMTPIRRPRPGILARTPFFDDQVLGAIRAAVPQVVICGAGYDDRALRFRSPGARFFELDHPATQADKARRLRAMGAVLAPALRGADADGVVLAPADFRHADVALAPADFRDADVAAVLAAAGHDASGPTLFLCEGLLIYLDQPVIRRLLTGLRSRAAPGSWLAASVATHPAGLDSAQVAAALNAGRRHGGTEPWLSVLPAPEWARLLASAGWHAESQTDPRAASPAEGHSLSPAEGRSLSPAEGRSLSPAEGRSLLVVARPAAQPGR